MGKEACRHARDPMKGAFSRCYIEKWATFKPGLRLPADMTGTMIRLSKGGLWKDDALQNVTITNISSLKLKPTTINSDLISTNDRMAIGHNYLVSRSSSLGVLFQGITIIIDECSPILWSQIQDWQCTLHAVCTHGLQHNEITRKDFYVDFDQIFACVWCPP